MKLCSSSSHDSPRTYIPVIPEIWKYTLLLYDHKLTSGLGTLKSPLDSIIDHPIPPFGFTQRLFESSEPMRYAFEDVCGRGNPEL